MSNAKEIELPHGTKAEAARRLGVSRAWVGEAWQKEVPEVVDMVLEVVKEWKENRDGVKQKIQQIATEIQTA